MTPSLVLLWIGYGTYVLAAVGLCAISVTALRWMLHAWRTTGPGPAPGEADGCDVAADPPRHSFSLVVPARHEERVLGATLARLAAIDHPSFEIVAVVGHDDGPTRQVAEEVARRDGRVAVVVDRSWPKTKPKALNTGLAACRGEIVGVFDAEDQVSLDVLRQVDAAFSRSGADVVQAGVQLVTPRAAWFALRNCLEYFLWFNSRIHAHATNGFFPLGGNTVFVRRAVLEAAGGWDGECLAEDCELGIRLAAHGARMAVSTDLNLATREETPGTLAAFVRQRTRWNQGYLQVLRRGWWRRLPSRRHAVLAAYLLAFPILQALTAPLVPLAVATMVWIRLPLNLALIGVVPALSTSVLVAVEVAAYHELRRSCHLPARRLDPLRLVLTTVPFQLVLAIAAVRAVCRELTGRRGWEKTAHAGAHLDLVAHGGAVRHAGAGRS